MKLNMDEISRQNLLTVMKRFSFERRRVTLASGRESDFYIDCKQTMLHPEGHHLIGRLFYEMWTAWGCHLDGVAGPELGGVPLACSFLSEAYRKGRRDMAGLIVRKQPKGHGTGAWIEGLKMFTACAGHDSLPVADGQIAPRVIVLEDVVTTGGTTLNTFSRLSAAGIDPVGVFALVDRQEGARETIEAVQSFGRRMPFASVLTKADFMGEGAT